MATPFGGIVLPIYYPDILNQKTAPRTFTYGDKDVMLYALGVGAGMTDPTGFELEFTTENSIDVAQKALPSMVVVLSLRSEMKGAGPLQALGSFNPAMLVHGEQAITLHGPIPTQGEVETVGTITGIYDKGKGAVIEVTEQPHTGCAKFIDRFGAEAMRFVNGSVGRPLRLRGLNARVVVPGRVRPGDAVTVTRP